MTIDYDNQMGSMDITCNDCNESTELQGTFQECVAELKEDGWDFFVSYRIEILKI